MRPALRNFKVTSFEGLTPLEMLWPTLVKNSWTAYPRCGLAALAYEYLCIQDEVSGRAPFPPMKGFAKDMNASPVQQKDMWSLLRQITAAVKLTMVATSPNDVHQRHSKGHGGQLVGFLLDLLLEGCLVALQEWLHAPFQDLLQDFHPFLQKRSQRRPSMDGNRSAEKVAT